MRENDRTGAAVASSGKIVPLPPADAPHGQDHLTWAYQTHVTAIYQYIYGRVGNRPDAEDLTAQVFVKAINGMRSDVSVPELRSWLYRRPARPPLGAEGAWGGRRGATRRRAAKPGAGRPPKECRGRVRGRLRGGVGEGWAQRHPVPRRSRRSLLLTAAAGIAAGIA